jgi:hypothetical protein
MAGKTETVGSTDKADRLKVFAQILTKRVREFALSGFAAKEPDYAKLEASMQKTKKPAVFTLRFENDKLIAEVSNVGTVLTMAALDVGKEKDREKRRAMLQSIRDHSDLVTKADLEAWDRKNPDPVKLGSLEGDVANLKKLVDGAANAGKDRPRTWKQMKEGEREVAFKSWMRDKKYDAYCDFLTQVQYGRDAKGLVEEYLKDGAKRPLKISKDSLRKTVVDEVAAGKKPKLDAITKDVTDTVDKVIPAYNDSLLKIQQANLPLLKKQLAEKSAELKAMTGR